MGGVRCGRCGRFLARAYAVTGQGGEGYAWHMFIAGVLGDCARCGPDAPAARGGWWWDWDAWSWPAEVVG